MKTWTAQVRTTLIQQVYVDAPSEEVARRKILNEVWDDTMELAAFNDVMAETVREVE